MSESIGDCWGCGHKLLKSDYGRESLCTSCSKSTRVCRNCRWFAAGRPNDCLEPMAEEVMDKTRANFCDFFEPTFNEAGPDTGANDLIKAAEDLFK